MMVRHGDLPFDHADRTEPERAGHGRRQRPDERTDLFVIAFDLQNDPVVGIGDPAGETGFGGDLPEEGPDASGMDGTLQFQRDTVFQEGRLPFKRQDLRASGNGASARSRIPKQ